MPCEIDCLATALRDVSFQLLFAHFLRETPMISQDFDTVCTYIQGILKLVHMHCKDDECILYCLMA